MKEIKPGAVPSKAECFALIKRFKMPLHIVRHSALVAHIALFIAQKLENTGCPIDHVLVEAGALLHDIKKSETLVTKENHARAGSDLLVSLGYPAVADIVRQHVQLDSGVSDLVVVSEAEIVNYADKRVKHDEVVDIEERFEDIQRRYAAGRPRLQKRLYAIFRETQALERKIFMNLDITPAQIIPLFSTNENFSWPELE